jgi:cytochrome c biogenesis protein CcdA
MNIRLKAGLEVAGFVGSAVAVGAAANFVLNTLSDIYGREQVIHGLLVSLMLGFLISMINLAYEVRVNQLKYTEKLKDTVKK